MREKESTQSVYGFIITKPLQLMIVLAILEQLPREIKKELLVIDYFADAEQVSDRLSDVITKECSVIFLKDDRHAFDLACNKKYEKLFMDSDVGFFRNLTLIRLKLHSNKTVLAVYEEGLGTYRDDLYFGVKKKILIMLGCGVNFGRNWLTKELYVYKIEDVPYKKNGLMIRAINNSIENLITHKWELLMAVFNAASTLNIVQTKEEPRCIIYLTGWDIDNDFIKILEKTNQRCFVKPHPHIKNKIFNDLGVIFIDSRIPAEIILNMLSIYYDEVFVIHHGSSADRYIDSKKIKFMTMNSFKKQFLAC